MRIGLGKSRKSEVRSREYNLEFERLPPDSRLNTPDSILVTFLYKKQLLFIKFVIHLSCKQ